MTNPKTSPVAESVVVEAWERYNPFPKAPYGCEGWSKYLILQADWYRAKADYLVSVSSMPRPIEDDTPTDAGEGVEPVAWVYSCESYQNSFAVTDHMDARAQWARSMPRWVEMPLYAHPAPTDTGLVDVLAGLHDDLCLWVEYGSVILPDTVHRSLHAASDLLFALSKAKDTSHG